MKKIISLILSAVLLVGAVCGLSSCGQTSDVQAVTSSGKLVVGITIYEPMDYIDEETGEWTGFDAELANAYAI